MMKSIAASLAALALLAGPGLAQTSCDPATLSAAIDRYAAEPFSARSWRVLQGLGDPMLEPTTADADTWANQEEWRKLTSQILPDHPEVQNVGWDCRIGYPLSVLKKRVDQLGADNAYVKQWLLAQEQVLRACSSQDGEITLPPPLADDAAVVNRQKADRAYQEASIAFYRDKQKAIPMFQAIAQSNSVHRAAAAYNVANLLANAKQPAEARKAAEAILADPSMASVHGITQQLLGYIANQEDTAAGWTSLIDADIAILETPADTILASEDRKRDYAAALYDIDFAGIRGKEGDWWLDGTLPENATISKSIVDAARQHPMALWMMAGQTANQKYQLAPWSLVGDKWQTRMSDYIGKALAVQPSGAKLSGPSLAMLKALSAKPDDATRAEVWNQARQAIDAAEKSCGTAPETAAAGFLLNQAVRLSAMAGKTEEAADGLAAVPFKGARAYSGTLYSLAQHLAGQGDVAAARKLRDGLITPEMLAGLSGDPVSADRNRFAALLAFIAEDEAQWKSAVRTNSDPGSDILFNLLPSKALWELAKDESFSARDRALFARAAWTRDYGLVRKVDGEYLETLHALNPEIKAISDKVKADYPDISARNQRLLTILRSPAHNILVAMPGGWQAESIKPDSFTEIDGWNPNDKNWWCPLEPDRQIGALRKQADDVNGFPDYFDGFAKRQLSDVYDPALREAVDKKRDAVLKAHPMVDAVNWKEIRALARMDQGPERLSDAAIRWAKSSKGQDGAPEALALAVKTTRYGCNWHGGHGRYSKAAQQLLATKFAGTNWAQQTPYWFDCRRTEWNKEFTEKLTTCKPMSWPKQAPLN